MVVVVIVVMVVVVMGDGGADVIITCGCDRICSTVVQYFLLKGIRVFVVAGEGWAGQRQGVEGLVRIFLAVRCICTAGAP